MHVQKLPSGKYRVIVQHNGARLQRTFPTRKAAKIGGAEILRGMVADSGAKQRRRESRYSVADIVDRHLEQATYSTTTRPEVERARERIPMWFAEMEAAEVTTPDVDRLYSDLAATLKPFAVRRVHELLSISFARALRWGWVRVNPVAAAEAPKTQRRIADPVETAKLTAVLAKIAANPEHAVMVRLALITGARRGELAGLRWEDFDLKARTLRIERSVACTPGAGLIVKDTKTGQSGRRSVMLDADTVAQVKSWKATLKAQEPELVEPDHYLFGTLDRPGRPDTLTQIWVRACERAGVLGVRLHDLRHHAASILIGAGIDPVTVAHRLGHANPTTTLRIYSHLVPGRDQAAADVISRSL